MQTLEALQRAIDTTEDLQSIVKTMKVLAAVSIRQYERAVESLADYSRTVELGLQAVMRRYRQRAKTGRRQEKRPLGAVVFGSDHGLCGRFNETITDFAVNGLQHLPAERRLLAVGARPGAGLEARGEKIEECFFVPGSVAGITATVQQILIRIDGWRSQGIDDVLLFYNESHSNTAHRPKKLQLLPVDLSRLSLVKERPWPGRSLPTYTMPGEQLFAALLRQHLFISIFRACAESSASEQASRLLSMQAAEKNIQERLEELAAQYRQQRQNAITEELLDVVSGFQALSGESAL